MRLVILSLILCNAVALLSQPEIVAEFVSVDYLWDDAHNESFYIQTGLFKLENNVITGVR
jgi:hypothetical protein